MKKKPDFHASNTIVLQRSAQNVLMTMSKLMDTASTIQIVQMENTTTLENATIFQKNVNNLIRLSEVANLAKIQTQIQSLENVYLNL